MLSRPDKPTLLTAIASFLKQDVLSNVDDKGLAFRVRIAVHLLHQVAGQLQHETPMREGELRSLAALLDREVPGGAVDDGIRELNQALSSAISAGDVDEEAVLAHLRRVIQADLAISNPRFETRLDIERIP